MHRFTVVIPSYNSSTYISETLKSIVRTAQGREYEVLVVDDFSSDIDDLEKIIKKFGGVKLIKKEKKSNAAHSRNIGIENAQHALVFLLDSDDALLLGAVDQRLRLHKEKKSGLIFGNYITVKDEVKKRSNMVWLGDPIRDFLFEKGGDFRTSSISVYKPYYKGTLFDKLSTKHQDWIFGMKCCDASESIAFDPDPISMIKVGSDSRMSSNLNIPASKFLVNNYLENQKHIDNFSLKHWRSAVANKDADALSYYISIYKPKDITGYARKLVYSLFKRKICLGVASYIMIIARKVKWRLWRAEG